MKVCVYAICKNESQFVDRFMDAALEADCVCVLDTGSTDDTVARLRARGAVVETAVITPWRFDAARNESMKLIPEDVDICCAVDLDEQFRPGWRAALERAWQADTTRARYRYTWSFRSDGGEGVVFWADKIHKNGCYRWHNPSMKRSSIPAGERSALPKPRACSSTITPMRRNRAGSICRSLSSRCARNRKMTAAATISGGSICSAASGGAPSKRSHAT